MVDLDTLQIGDRAVVVFPGRSIRYGIGVFDISRFVGKEVEIQSIDRPGAFVRQAKVKRVDHPDFFYAMPNELESVDDKSNTLEDWS